MHARAAGRAAPGGGAQELRRAARALSAFVERAPLPVVAASAALFHLLLYLAANRFQARPAVELAQTWIDRAVPLLPWTSFLYVSCHFLVLAGFACCRSAGAGTRFATVFAATVVAAVSIHWALPTRFPREAFPLGGTGAGELVLGWFRLVDRPTSALPSLHVAMAVISALGATRERLRAAPALWLWCALVSLSTLTTKQHLAVDVAAGAVLALAVDAAVTRLMAPARRRAFAGER